MTQLAYIVSGGVTDDWDSLQFQSIPYHIWLYDTEEACFRVTGRRGSDVLLETGYWLPPIPTRDRRNRNVNLRVMYPRHHLCFTNGKRFTDSIATRKTNADIVAWFRTGQRVLPMNSVLEQYDRCILKQQWKCRYCNHVNQSSTVCSGIYHGQLPSGGPKKANNSVLGEYEYFLSRNYGFLPCVLPFDCEPHIGWCLTGPVVQPRRCGARRCIHPAHINRSDQILSFPRAPWQGGVQNTAQHYLPGAMLGHQVTSAAVACPKCRHPAPNPHIQTDDREHAWWVIESLYWLKVDIYNKKMQSLSGSDADDRYKMLLDAVDKLKHMCIGEYTHVDGGCFQTVPYNRILAQIGTWLSDRKRYDQRFERVLK